ncbi:MAG: rhodanese-like domain-containing protein, partial [Flavobacteriaceae bacterium]|nr:rhodanese-like domain-containing protein [Flavobacteriaceae bacterium]
ITRLSRVGFDQTIGYLEGSFEAWKSAAKDYDTITSIDAQHFKAGLAKGQAAVVDVRKDGEFAAEHIEKAIHIPLDYINEKLQDFPQDQTFFMHCAGGYRSVIAASILKSRGIHNFIDVSGGMKDIKAAGIPLTDYVCPTTL